jgi:hypothetical protein
MNIMGDAGPAGVVGPLVRSWQVQPETHVADILVSHCVARMQLASPRIF